MPSVSYGTGAYKKDNGNFPPLQLINMYVEKSKTSEQGVAILSRKGVSVAATVGAGPIHGIYAREGVYDNSQFVISGGNAYRNGTLLGPITGAGSVSFASSGPEVVFTLGNTAYSYNGTDLAAIAFPDGADVAAVTFIGSLFVFVRKSTGKFYWSAPLNGRSVNALDFATAEREDDNLLDVRALGDNLWLFGQYSTEIWPHTGAADLPFSRLEQVSINKGILNPGAVRALDNTLFWVGSDFAVYRAGETPQRVSDHWLESKIEQAGTAKTFICFIEGHWNFCVRLPSETYAYDVSTGEWWELQYNGGQFAGQCSAYVEGTGMLFGSASESKIYAFDGWEDDGHALERRFTAYTPLDKSTIISRVSLWANTGHVNDLDADPIIEMRPSSDAGNEWEDWQDDTLGVEGNYRHVPEWRALGSYDFPGILMDFRVTDPVPLRVSAIKVNDPAGSRSRG